MNLNQLLFNPDLAKYIIAIQIPVVFCLCFLSYQAYKLGFKPFRLICLGWILNVCYLLAGIALKPTEPNTLITFLDLASAYFFFSATFQTVRFKGLDRLKTRKAIYYIPVFLLAGLARVIPGSLHLVPYVHLRYVPASLILMIALISLGIYFRKVAKRFNRWPALAYATFVYAVIQILSAAQEDKFDKNTIICLNNIGFSVGLIVKTIILISLSHFLIQSIMAKATSDKNNLVYTLNYASAITVLDLKNEFLRPARVAEEENNILRLVLEESLNLLDEKLGFYVSYDNSSGTIKILYASPPYQDQVNKVYKSSIGLTGKAIADKTIQIMNVPKERPEYVWFEKNDANKKVKSAVAIPVIIQDQVIGVYMIESESANYFINQVDVNTFNVMVERAVVAITLVRLLHETTIGERMLENLKNIDRSLVSLDESKLKSTLKDILGNCLDLVNGETGFIALINKNELTLIATVSNAEKDTLTLETLKIDDSISGLAVIRKEPVYIRDLKTTTDEEKKLFKPILGIDHACELVVPLFVQDEIIGVFNTESRTPDKFKPADIKNIEGFAGQAAVAIYIYKLLDDINRYRSHTKALAAIDHLILSADQSLDETLGIIIETGIKLTNKQDSEIILLNETPDGEQVLVNKRSTHKTVEGTLFPMDSICGLTIKKEKTVYLPFIDKKEAPPVLSDTDIYIPNEEERLKYKVPGWGPRKSELVLPLIIEDRVIGVYNTESLEYNDFREEQIAILKNLALAASVAIHYARLLEQLQEKNNQLENSIRMDKVDLSARLGNLINHRINNSLGGVQVPINHLFKKGKFGPVSEEAMIEFDSILACVDKAIAANEEIRSNIIQTLYQEPELVKISETWAKVKKKERIESTPGIYINTIGIDDLPEILIDQNILYEILAELVSNAIKAMPRGGTITIRGDVEDDFVVLQIIDEGIGIDPAQLQNIYAKHFSHWPEGREKGTGKGLFHVKNAAELYRGSITVESKQGQGTTFFLKLPTSK